MAEEISNGRITISEAETNTPILVSTANFIQIPTFQYNAQKRVYISKHGNMQGTWISLVADTVLAITPPFYVYSKHKCIIPCMEV